MRTLHRKNFQILFFTVDFSYWIDSMKKRAIALKRDRELKNYLLTGSRIIGLKQNLKDVRKTECI